MNKITKYLNQHINGQVFDRPSILNAYSRDKSVIEVTPRLVAVPYDTDDIQFLLRFANDVAEKDFKLPPLIRLSKSKKPKLSVKFFVWATGTLKLVPIININNAPNVK